jgi:hypothetical protein
MSQTHRRTAFSQAGFHPAYDGIGRADRNHPLITPVSPALLYKIIGTGSRVKGKIEKFIEWL